MLTSKNENLGSESHSELNADIMSGNAVSAAHEVVELLITYATEQIDLPPLFEDWVSSSNENSGTYVGLTDIAIRDSAGVLSQDILNLFKMAAQNSNAGADSDVSLRLGSFGADIPGTGHAFLVEIIAETGGQVEVLKFTGAAAQDLIAAHADLNLGDPIEADPGQDLGPDMGEPADSLTAKVDHLLENALPVAGETHYENFKEGSRTDPIAKKIVNADGTAKRVILDLGDRSKTIEVNDSTEQIFLLNKLVEFRSHYELELDETGKVVKIDKSGGDGADIEGGRAVAFTDPESGFGIHIAARSGDQSDNAQGKGPKLDGFGNERGHNAKKIDTRDVDGNVSDELITLFTLAMAGGAVDTTDDMNLRLGHITMGDISTGEGFAVDIIVDGKWSSDVLRITGALARDLLDTLPEQDDSDTGDGSTDDGSTDDGSTGDGSTGDGSTGDGSTGDGSTGDGSTGDGSTDDGSTGDGSTGDGSTGDGSTGDGSTGDGSTGDGSTGDGSTGDGSTGDGSTGDGSTGDGSTDDGSTGDGSTGDGSTDDGTDDTGSGEDEPDPGVKPFDVSDRLADTAHITGFDGPSDPTDTILIGSSASLPKGTSDDWAIVDEARVIFNDVYDLFAAIEPGTENHGGDPLTPEETSLLIQAGVFTALTGRNVIDGLRMGFEGDPDSTDTVTLTLTNTGGTTDILTVQGPGVTAAIAAGLGSFTGADLGSVSFSEFKADNPDLYFTLLRGSAPIAQDATHEGIEDTVINGAALATDDDGPDGDLVFAAQKAALNGSVKMQADGSFVYTPDADFAGSDRFTYTVTDENGYFDIGTISLTIAQVDDAPTVTPIEARDVTEDDAPVTIDLLKTVSDPDSPDAVFTASNIVVSDPTGPIAFADNGDNTITIDPDLYTGLAARETRDVTVRYDISDGLHTLANTATLTVLGINDAPTLVLPDGGVQLFVEQSGAAQTFDLFPFADDVDSDDDASTLAYSVAVDLSEGSASFDGSILTFDPIDDFKDLGAGQTRQVEVVVKVTDSHDIDSATARIQVDVTGINDAPVAGHDVTRTNENATRIISIADLLLNDTDVDVGDTLEFVSFDTEGTKGLVTDNGDGTLTYDPNGQFNEYSVGEVGRDSFTYTVRDAAGELSTATVGMLIDGVGKAPQPVYFSDNIITSRAGDSKMIGIYSGVSDGEDADTVPDMIDDARVQGTSARGLHYLETGDINGDNLVDVVIGGSHASVILYSLGTTDDAGQPQFSQDTLAFDFRSYAPLLVDLDGDGDLDLVNTWQEDSFSLNLGNDEEGHAIFSTPEAFADTGTNVSYDADAADFNGDGLMDLLIPDRSASGVTQIHYATGDTNGNGVIGTGEALSYVSQSFAGSAGNSIEGGVAAADFDEDGDQDFVVGHWVGANAIDIYENLGNEEETGMATFEMTSVGVPGTTSPSNLNIKVIDLNGDGKDDILGTSFQGSTFIGYNESTADEIIFDMATLGSAAETRLSYGVSAGDFDGDGDLDIVLSRNASRDGMLFFENEGVIDDPDAANHGHIDFSDAQSVILPDGRSVSRTWDVAMLSDDELFGF